VESLRRKRNERAESLCSRILKKPVNGGPSIFEIYTPASKAQSKRRRGTGVSISRGIHRGGGEKRYRALPKATRSREREIMITPEKVSKEVNGCWAKKHNRAQNLNAKHLSAKNIPVW